MVEPMDMQDLFAGLRELAESAFPKRCRACGREYANAAEFVAATRPPRPGCSGLKQGHDDDERLIVEVFRNCQCGSTLMESFGNRRDLGPEGIKRRRRFEQLLGYLLARGVAAEIAHAELLKVMRGEANTLLQLIRDHNQPL